MPNMTTTVKAHAPPGVASRAQDITPAPDKRPADRTYVASMADPRHANFAAFVARAVRAAKETHGWTQEEVARRSGFSRSTLQRWLAGEWKQDPKAGEIEDFCDALNIPTEIPLMILWPGRARRAEPSDPLPLADPDFDLIARRLRDPNVSSQEKFHIRETIRSLARSARRVG